jgi:hypothetical protein
MFTIHPSSVIRSRSSLDIACSTQPGYTVHPRTRTRLQYFAQRTRASRERRLTSASHLVLHHAHQTSRIPYKQGYTRKETVCRESHRCNGAPLLLSPLRSFGHRHRPPCFSCMTERQPPLPLHAPPPHPPPPCWWLPCVAPQVFGSTSPQLLPPSRSLLQTSSCPPLRPSSQLRCIRPCSGARGRYVRRSTACAQSARG